MYSKVVCISKLYKLEPYGTIRLIKRREYEVMRPSISIVIPISGPTEVEDHMVLKRKLCGKFKYPMKMT